MAAIGLSKQQALDDDPKAKKQINFTGNLERVETQQFFSLLKKQKKKHFRFFIRNCEIMVNLFYFNTV